jgi:hypothetical protein
MKKTLKFSKYIIVLLAIILLTQCEDDDSSPSFTNTIKLNGSDFKIESASMIGISMEDFGHTSISFASGNSTKGEILSIDVESYTQQTIEGDYAYPEVSGKKELDDWLTNYTVFEGTNIVTTDLETGEVSIIHNGDSNYTVDVDLEMTDGTTFIGSYTGEFQVAFSNH